MNLVQEYYRLANEVISYRETVYDRNSAKNHNRKVNKMDTIAVEIQQDHPELKAVFYALLSDENPEIRLWTAHHVLEHIKCERVFRKKALHEIRRRARTEKTANGFGERVWLKAWYKNHPMDRWL